MDELLDAWMDLGPTVAPDRLANATRAQVRTMPQRRATWWPVRRSLEMRNTLRYAAVGVGIAAALIFGVLILMPGTEVGPAPSATPEPTAVPTPVPTPFPSQLRRSEPGFLPPDDYRHSAFYVPFTITVPADWTSLEARPGFALLVKTRDAEPFGTVNNIALLSVTAINGVFADPCRDTEPISPAPATVNAIVDAFTHQVDVRSGPVTTEHLGSYEARAFDMDNSIDGATCHEGLNGPFTQWTFLEAPGQTSVNSDGTGGHSRMWVLDVQGTLVLIYAAFDPVTTPQAAIDEVLQMAASVRFD